MTNQVHENQMRGVFFMIIACLFFAISNNLIKHLSVSVSPVCMVFYKNFASFLVLIPLAFFMKGTVFDKKHFKKYNIIRSLIDVASIALWFKAIESAPISQAVAVTFLTPFFISLIAVFILKEKMESMQWTLMAVGLIGAIIVAKPNIDMNYGILYAIAASILWAISAVLFKKLTLVQGAFIIIFFLKGMKSVISLPFLIMDFHLLNANQLLFLLFLSVFSNGAIFFVSLAYKHANISMVIPFDFLRLVLTSLIAFLIFSEEVEGSTIYGSMIILFASSLLAGRVRRKDVELKISHKKTV